MLLPHILSGWDDHRAQRCLFQQRCVAFRIFIHGGAVQGSSPAVQRLNCSLADGQWLGLVWFSSMVPGAGGFFFGAKLNVYLCSRQCVSVADDFFE